MKKLQFIDNANNLVKIEVETERGHLSICGEMGGSCGQILDNFEPATDAQRELVQIWKEHHLHQPTEEVTDRLTKVLDTLREEEHERIRLAAERSQYRIEENDEEMLEAIMKEKDCRRSHALRYVAIMRETGMEFSELEHIEETNDHYFTAYGVEYIAGTGDELDNLAREYMKDTADDCYLEVWINQVKENGERRGFDDWCYYVVDTDGFASILNSWDGKYTDDKIFEEWICVCRA